MKTENNKITISSAVCRTDSFKEKVDKVNTHLEEICSGKDVKKKTLWPFFMDGVQLPQG